MLSTKFYKKVLAHENVNCFSDKTASAMELAFNKTQVQLGFASFRKKDILFLANMYH